MISDFYEKLGLMTYDYTRNEFGDTIHTLVERLEIEGAISINNSSAYILAEKVGNKSTATLLVKNNIDIANGTFILRKKNGIMYKVVSNKNDFDTPAMAEITKDYSKYLLEGTVVE